MPNPQPTVPPTTLQTIHIETLLQANRLVKRLTDAGHYFICQYSHPYFGRWISFSDRIDFERDRSLFQGIAFRIILSPADQQPPE
jgi:hypothetical protein